MSFYSLPFSSCLRIEGKKETPENEVETVDLAIYFNGTPEQKKIECEKVHVGF